MKAALFLLVLFAVVLAARADVYLHTPRGSNNRCDENNNDRNNNERLFNSQDNNAGGYAWAPQMYYYTGSELSFEWYNQHACGSNGNVKCNIVWQYACADTIKDGTPADLTGDTQSNTCVTEITEANQDDSTVGRHEPFSFFDDCNTRLRNTNLFAADENPGDTNNAQHTRQNPGGGTTGFECQEERDYYPYWHPTMWRDIAVMTTNISRCDWYTENSENKKGRNYCDDPQYNNEDSCTAGGGNWQSNPSHGLKAPECVEAPWSRDNHLGSGSDGYMNTYNWTIPSVKAGDSDICVLRLRYNMSSSDYDDFNIDAGSNDNASPVKDDPYITYGSMVLRLAIDTNQFGRTFEDRSYTFKIKPKPAKAAGAKIYNLGVRGKRGNIAQVRNCVEYDFVPNRLHAGIGDFVHIQWTGSNHNDRGNAGEGKTGWDRSNIVQIINNDMAANYIEDLKTQTLFKSESTAYRAAYIDQENYQDCKTLEELEAADDDTTEDNCAKLNGEPTGYFDLGMFRLNKSGEFHYMSTRNNNFSNRSQKASIIIKAITFRTLIIIIIAAAALGIGGAAGGIYLVSKRKGGFKGFRSTSSFGSSRASANGVSSGRSHGSHRSKNSKGSFGGSMI